MHTRPSARETGPASPASLGYVDLQAGSKVRVVIPILRSGGYILPSLKKTSGNVIEIETGDDFLGYEKAWYEVKQRSEGGVRVHFTHAEVWDKGKIHKRNRTRLPVFSAAMESRHIRLVYLTRWSKADHDMAIVASRDPATLDDLTRAVIERAECRTFSATASCTWVPQGIAVTPIEH